MKTVLLTGTTGFLGSALAASLLNRGHRILSLSRNDSDGSRTRQAIREAATGFNLALEPGHWSNLRLIEVTYADLGAELSQVDLSEITDAWHCAAHMSYSPKKLDESLRQNLEASVELYELLQRRAPACRRFYHVSTAYTAGILGGRVAEELHPRPRLINAYQISKWSAEQALANLSRAPGALPVALFRPTIIVGHSRSGWSPGSRFGYFMFVHALAMASQAGVREITIDLSPEARPNLIPVDEVVHAATALCERPESAGLEIFHCANPSALSTQEHLRIIGRRLGIEIKVGTARTALDRQLNERIAWNREFASTTYAFDTSKLASAAGAGYCREPMTESQYVAGIDFFLKRAGIEADLRPRLRYRAAGFIRTCSKLIAPSRTVAR